MSSTASGPSWRREDSNRGVRTLWFDQPGRPHNILDPTAIDELESHLVEAESDNSVRGLVLRSAKPGGFCAGAELKTILDRTTPADIEDLLLHGLALIDHLAELAIPTVAVIHGVCLGGGLELALACRRRVAMASAAPLQMGMPEVQLGLIPGWEAITRLPRLIGPDDALDLLLTGRSIGYLLARSLGIVDRLAAEADPTESLDLTGSTPSPQKTWSREVWEGALDRARARLDDQPGDHPEVQERIISIVATDIAQGQDAARQAVVRAFVDLAMSEDTRESLAEFFQLERDPSRH